MICNIDVTMICYIILFRLKNLSISLFFAFIKPQIELIHVYKLPSMNRTSTVGYNRRRRVDRHTGANINLTEIRDLMEDVGRNLKTKDGQVINGFYSLLYLFDFCYTWFR